MNALSHILYWFNFEVAFESIWDLDSYRIISTILINLGFVIQKLREYGTWRWIWGQWGCSILLTSGPPLPSPTPPPIHTPVSVYHSAMCSLHV